MRSYKIFEIPFSGFTIEVEYDRIYEDKNRL